MKTTKGKSIALLILMALIQFSTFGQDSWPRLITSETDTLVVNTIENVRKQTKLNEINKEAINARDSVILIQVEEIKIQDSIIANKDTVINYYKEREGAYERLQELHEQEVDILEQQKEAEKKRFKKARRWAIGSAILNGLFILFISTNG